MDLFDLFIKIGVKDDASDKVANLTSKLGGGLKAAAQVGVAAVAAAGTGIAALTKSAIENYAEYEQLVGGVETLFKDSAGRVQEFAASAYKTAGLSANEYMSTVTSFSASLISSLDGDTTAAAEYANRAIVSMSNNANKMGTSMESIQNAYQGFAKQNYTMLDNLKLGYGGTQSEMQRLIADAAAMTDVQEKLGVTIDASSMSFDNIVNAIDVMQAHLGIAGATAAEAEGTISGSVAAMQSAWQNLVTGVADENANFEDLVTQFVDSAMIAAENIIPRVEVALMGAGKMLDTIVPMLIDKIPEWIERYLPMILESGISIVLQIVAGLIKAIPQLVSSVPQLVKAVVNAFKSQAGAFKDIGTQIVSGVWTGIKNRASKFASDVRSFFKGIVSNAKKALGIASPSKVFASIGGFMAEGLEVGWNNEYNAVKNHIDKDLQFDQPTVNYKVGSVDYSNSGLGQTNGVASVMANAMRAAEENMTIVVQSVLDGKVIGETAYQYAKGKQRAYGV